MLVIHLHFVSLAYADLVVVDEDDMGHAVLVCLGRFGAVPIDPADFHFVVERLLLHAGLEFFPSH
jgi:hypothetical protein